MSTRSNNQPILSHSVIKDAETGLRAILKLYEEMESRKKDQSLQDRPYIVCVIDEFPRLFSEINNKEEKRKLELALTNLLSGGRHSKIHMILAAQDPTQKQMVCGIGNLSAKIALRCNHYHRSVTILGRTGADKLIGNGQMILDAPPAAHDKRLQGSYISEKNIDQLLSEIRSDFNQINQYPFVIIESELLQTIADEAEEKKTVLVKHTFEDDFESNLVTIIELLIDKGQISNDAVQKRLEVAYHKANGYLEKLEEYNLIPPLNGKRKPRKINTYESIDLEKLMELLMRHYSEEDIENRISKIPSYPGIKK